MATLSEYIRSGVTTYDESIPLTFQGGAYLSEIEKLLSDMKVFPVSPQDRRRLPSILLSRAEFSYHKELIELVISYFIETNINNAVTLGLVLGEVSRDTDSSLFSFKGHNAALNILLSKPMEAIKIMLGTKGFLELLVNTKCVWLPTNTVLWGDLGAKASYSTTNMPKSISMRPMLYVLSKDLPKKNPLPHTAVKLFYNMFSSMTTGPTKNVPKRFRKVYKLTKLIVNNHKAHMLTYPYIFEQICGNNDAEQTNNFSLATSKDRVLKFVMTIIYKVIPLELFGTSKNRVTIMRKLVKFMNGNVFERTKVSCLLNGISINDTEWVKPRSLGKMTKPEFLKARQMYMCFIYWLFSSFVCRVVCVFFHVTQASQGIRPLFFKHSTWNKISRRFLSKYFISHLSVEKDTKNSFESFAKNEDHIGQISLHPKKTGFRLIVKPFKGSKEERIEYLTYQKRKLRPINKILMTIRDTQCCMSLIDIVNEVYSFKKSLLSKYEGKLPKIYAFKFDVKNAYDSLPHSTIEKAVKENLDRYTTNDMLYTHIFSKVGMSGRPGALFYYVTDDLTNISHPDASGKWSNQIKIDTHETLSFSKSDVIAFVRAQYKNTCFHTTKRSYYRTIGVYQGFPLSGTLFNIVYDSVTRKLYEMLDTDAETKIIRLMDDFLILSTKESLVHKMRKVTARCIKEYNLNSNRLKSELTTANVLFAGLRIDVANLVCYKTVAEYNNSPICATSFPCLYKQIQRYSDIWTRNHALFDKAYDASGIGGARANVHYLLKSLLYKFINSYRILRKVDVFHVGKFFLFWKKLMRKLSTMFPLRETKFNFNRYWNICLRTLASKGIVHKH
jgi:telomerase reverse transcriptase